MFPNKEDHILIALRGGLVQARHSYRSFSVILGGCVLIAATLITKILLGYIDWFDLPVIVVVIGITTLAERGRKFLAGVWSKTLLEQDLDAALAMLDRTQEYRKAGGGLNVPK